MIEENINYPNFKETTPKQCFKDFCSTKGGVSADFSACQNGDKFPSDNQELLDYILEHAESKQDVVDMLQCGKWTFGTQDKIVDTNMQYFKDKDSKDLTVSGLWELVQNGTQSYSVTQPDIRNGVLYSPQGNAVNDNDNKPVKLEIRENYYYSTTYNEAIYDNKGHKITTQDIENKKYNLNEFVQFARKTWDPAWENNVEIILRDKHQSWPKEFSDLVDYGHAMLKINGNVYGFNSKHGIPVDLGCIEYGPWLAILSKYASGSDAKNFAFFELNLSAVEAKNLINNYHQPATIKAYVVFWHNCTHDLSQRIDGNTDIDMPDLLGIDSPHGLIKYLQKEHRGGSSKIKNEHYGSIVGDRFVIE